MNLKTLYPNIDTTIKGITSDSRKVKDGFLFICIEGFNVDGHDYVDSAVKNGAAAILAERELDVDVPLIVVSDTYAEMAKVSSEFYDHPTKKMKLVGTTGTNGKTTTALIIEHILSKNEKVGYLGTVGVKVAGKDLPMPTRNTTPESSLLQKLFSDMLDKGVTSASIEVSSHALSQQRVNECEFDVGVFTNLTNDHLDAHNTMEEYLESKAKLFSLIKSDGYAVINSDDDYSFEYLKGVIKVNTYTYGVENDADFKADNVKLTAKNATFDLVTPSGTFKVESPMLAMFNVYNVLAAIASTYALGHDLKDIIERIKTIPIIPGRMEFIDEGQDFSVIVDYAHTEDGLEKLVKFVSEVTENEFHLVFGCQGDRDPRKRPIMAKIGVEHSDKPIMTIGNPWSEDPNNIIKNMESGVIGEDYTVIIDRKEAIKHAVKNAKKGDTVVVAGRGQESVMYLNTGTNVKTIPMDDRLICRDALKEKLKK